MTAPNLKPCPFCGGNASISKDHDPDGSGAFYAVKCHKCRAKSSEIYAVETCNIHFAQVRDAWNRRADLAAVPAQVKVKQMVWHDCADGTSHDDGCRYEIERDGKQYWRIIRGVTGGSSYLKHARSRDEAKSLAQADYEARILAAIEPQPDPRDEHFDDYAVRSFAKMMAAKMAASRAKGRSGWDDPAQCSVEYLRRLLYAHLDKGDPVDVANICMMLRHYDASTAHEYESSAMAAACASRDEVIARLGPIADLLPDAVAAAEKAMRKFPQPNYVISKWAEETGEVTKDLIHMAEGRQTVENLRGEIVQSLAMLHRLLVEGDQVHGLPPIAAALAAAKAVQHG